MCAGMEVREREREREREMYEITKKFVTLI